MFTTQTLTRSVLGRFGVSVATLVVLACAAFATIAVDQAHSAVERELRSKVRDSIRIVFSSDHEERLSQDERRVSGNGYFIRSESNDRNAFTYSVRVNIDTRRTTGLSVQYDRFNRGRDDGRRPDSFRFELREPSSGARVGGPKVYFSGTGDGKQVRVDIYEGGDRRVSGQYFTIKNGRWDGSLNLRDGQYRAVARLVGSNREVTISFSVRGGDRGRDPDRYGRLSIERPRERETVDGRRVVFSGVSDSDTVTIRLYDDDDNNRRVLERTVTVRGGRWSTDTDLRRGSYHANIEAVGRGVKETVKFRVR